MTTIHTMSAYIVHRLIDILVIADAEVLLRLAQRRGRRDGTRRHVGPARAGARAAPLGRAAQAASRDVQGRTAAGRSGAGAGTGTGAGSGTNVETGAGEGETLIIALWQWYSPQVGIASDRL